jgi:hypothetical protein
MMNNPLSSFLALGAVALCAMGAPHQAHADSIVNGSFEADSFNSGGGYRLGLTGNDVTGWFIPTSDGTYPWGLQNSNSFGAGPTPYGNQWLVLGETGAGGPSMVDRTIQQTMTGLTPGNTYTLSFAISSEGTGSGASCCSVGQVSFLSGSSTAARDFTAPASHYWSIWGTDSMNFLATNSSVTLQFKDLAVEFPSGNDLGLDNVSVRGLSATPLPPALPLFATGLGLLGLLGWRRRRKDTTAIAI